MDASLIKLWEWAVANGFAIPLYFFIGWKMWKEMESKQNMEEKKKSGEFVSWESMNERIKGMENKINGQAEQFNELHKEFKTQMAVESLEEGRFVKLESNADHLKDNITDIKENLAEIKRDINQGFAIMADIKNLMIQNKGH